MLYCIVFFYVRRDLTPIKKSSRHYVGKTVKHHVFRQQSNLCSSPTQMWGGDLYYVHVCTCIYY